MPHAIRPGDVLADRYHLVDLLDESAGGLFCRAHDACSTGRVAVHMIRADDDRARLLREAARTSARVRRPPPAAGPRRRRDHRPDRARRSARASSSTSGRAGVSLDILLAAEGPLAPRRAAWLVSEVAATLEVAHAAGVAHGRLVPENVLIDRTGSVRVIGFAVDAALHGLPAGRAPADVTDLAGLLYAALTGPLARAGRARPSSRRRWPTAACCARGRCAPGSPACSTRCATRSSTRTPAHPARTPAAPTT